MVDNNQAQSHAGPARDILTRFLSCQPGVRSFFSEVSDVV